MTDIVERVARACCMATSIGTEPCEFADGSLGGGQCTVCRGQARAAIGAMREPTEDMKLAGREYANEHAGHCWQSMIDAALGGGHD